MPKKPLLISGFFISAIGIVQLIRWFAPVLLALILVACSAPQFTAPGLPVERKAAPYLEQSYAGLRAQQLADIHYNLHMQVDETGDSFSGDILIDFRLGNNNKMPVTLDFDGGEVTSIQLNGKKIEWQYNRWFISIAPDLFNPGKNTLAVSFNHKYATAGDGLHRFQDQQTGRVYLYSNFEPFNAHKMFPHFDQPDLKATYQLSVLAPTNWQVISAAREIKVTAQSNKRNWLFPITPPISSYVFSLHAGPYVVWEDKSSAIPLRLFARQEMAPYVNSQDWFIYTKNAFDFYNQYFGYAYPFKKYDQILVPDFNSGAMENVAAVTFNESYLGRGEKTYLLRMRTANVIAHEMAHMWFGDLVTMSWWNGLWLNESVATFMASLQQAKNSEFKNDAWDVFTTSNQQWGYVADRQVTRHPIELPIANTAEAFSSFDGITYGKGASVMKQLFYVVGEDSFKKALRLYIKKYAYRNTQLKDFINEVGVAAGLDLTEWSNEWLYTEGVNNISVDYECAGEGAESYVTRMELVQSTSGESTLGKSTSGKNPRLRHQRVKLGFYYWEKDQLQLKQIVNAGYESERTAVATKNPVACPAFVYPNLGDWGYVKVVLDKKSRQFVLDHINSFDSSLRKTLWQNLWDEVEEAHLPLTGYLEFVKQHIATEVSVNQTAGLLVKLQTASNYFWWMTQAGQDHSKELADIEAIAYLQLIHAKPASDAQRVMFDAYVALAFSPDALARLHNYLQESNLQESNLQEGNLPEGLVLDQDRRWAVLKRLNQFAYKNYVELTLAESRKDASDLGQQMALVCEAVRPEKSIKEKWLRELADPSSTYKLATQRAVIKSLFMPNQTALYPALQPSIAAALPRLQGLNNDRFLSVYTEYLLAPHGCNLTSLKKLETIRDQYAPLGPTLKKLLNLNLQEEQRCVDMMNLMEK